MPREELFWTMVSLWGLLAVVQAIRFLGLLQINRKVDQILSYAAFLVSVAFLVVVALD